MSLSSLVSFKSRFVTYLLNFPHIMFILSPVIYSVRFKHIPQTCIFKHILFSSEQKTKFQTHIKTTEKIIVFKSVVFV